MSWKLHSISEFEDYQDNWQQLNLATSASPLLSLEFVLPLLQVFRNGKEILACYKEKNELQAMAIIRPKNKWEWNTFQPSQAPLGMWIQKSDADLSYLVSSLVRQLDKYPLILGITQQDPDLIPRLENDNKLRTLDYIKTAKVSLQGSFEDYWADRGKNLRQNMKKQRNKLSKEGILTRLELCTAPADVQQAILEYGKLESAGWKVNQGTAIHPSNDQGQFYRMVLENFCHQDRGRIYKYWFNDQIVAMDLCIEGNDSMIILKTTYDESLGHSFSPAFLMREEMFRQLFAEKKVKRIEFYGRVMDWHTKWSNEVRTLYHVNGYRWSVLPALHDAASKIATRCR